MFQRPNYGDVDESPRHLCIGVMDAFPPEILALPSGPTRVKWRRSLRARRISLRIDPTEGGVIVTLPSRATRKAGMALLMGHIDWVMNRIAALPQAVSFVDGASVPICDRPHRIRHAPQARGGVWIQDEELRVTGAADFIARRVRDFLHQEARRHLSVLAMTKVRRIGIVPRRITIKDTKSRWGSCAPDTSLALSWRLVMAPSFVQDYVVAHEVAHLRHMNHGRQFWTLVDELTPYRSNATAWLRAEGARLLRMG